MVEKSLLTVYSSPCWAARSASVWNCWLLTILVLSVATFMADSATIIMMTRNTRATIMVIPR